MVDIAILSLNRRFEQLNIFEGIFGFLFNHTKLSSLDDNTLHKCCVTLQDALKHNDKYDIDANNLFSELQVLQMCFSKEVMSIIEVLEFVKVSDWFLFSSCLCLLLLDLLIVCMMF